MNDSDERSSSGAPVWRHAEREKPFEGVAGNEESIEAISEHIEEFVGPIELVLHEAVSDLVHIDLHWVKATDSFPFHVLVTSGMSDLPMATPDGVKECQYSELLITLPDGWPIDMDSFQDEAIYWPIRMVKVLARMPHEYDTWIWWNHTVEHGNPPAPYHESTRLQAALIAPPLLLPQDFSLLEVNQDKQIAFFSAIPIYKEELKLKMNKGVEALYDRFDECGINEVIDPTRKNSCASWWKKFLSK